MNRPMSINQWGYVEGNPVNVIDPSGNKPHPPHIPNPPEPMGPWCLPTSSSRAHFAEQYVNHQATSETLRCEKRFQGDIMVVLVIFSY